MIKFSFLLVEGLYTAVWVLIRIIVCLIKKRIDWKRELMLLLMYVNLAVIIRFSFFPMELADGKIQSLILDAATVFPFRINYIPFTHLFEYNSRHDTLLNLIGNVTMYIPSGIILPVIYKKLDRFWKVFAAGALISICVEICQLPFSVRSTDINDLILNVFGVAIGYLLYSTVKIIIKKIRSKRSSAH